MDMDISSGSDDGDAYVADLLQQFAKTDGNENDPFQNGAESDKEGDEGDDEGDIMDTRSDNPSSTQESDAKVKFAIEIPAKDDLSDYELIPGHSIVDKIIYTSKRTADNTFYYAQLLNGEKKTISSDHLKTLVNGSQALETYHSDRVNGHTRSARSSESESSEPQSLQSSRSTSLSKGVASRRAVRRQPGEGFVNWGTLDLSSDEISRSPVRSLRPRETQYTVQSEESSSEPSDTDASFSSKKRKTRFSQRVSKKPKVTAVRYSERTRHSTRNMKERMEGDISEADVKAAETKYLGTKEVFEKVPKDDEFRIHHRPECDTCFLYGDDDVKGPLVFCQGCTNSYHKACLGPRGSREHLVTKVDEGKFVLQCRRCLGVAHSKDPLVPHRGACASCKKIDCKPFRSRITTRQEQTQREENGGIDPITDVEESLLDNVENIMLRCVTCSQAWHMSHLTPDQGSDTAFKEFSRRWTCKNCTDSGEIESLVAWRPANLETFIPGYTADMIPETELEYLIKWRKRSYFRTAWMPGGWVWGVTASAMRRAFDKSAKNLKPKMTTEDAVPEEYLRIDIIFDVKYSNVVRDRTQQIDMARAKEVDQAYVKFKGLTYEDAVWEEIPPVEDTERWKDYMVAYEDWVLSNYVHLPRSSALAKRLAHVRAQPFEASLMKHKQPEALTGGTIMDYQKDGLNWLYYMWYKKQNAILADEMGLGKTIQVIALFATLIEDHKCFPFLVVVPNSTCPNWRREIKTWAPSLRVVTYYGSSAARKIAHDYEMFPGGGNDLRCHILVTSYETMIDEKARRIFSKVSWAGLVVDEGQRLKNDKNMLYEALTRIHFPFRLLLTGTPLQNNIRELFNLLQFCDSSKNAKELEETYASLTNENVPELHEIIRPFFLRRTKAQVLTFLPPVAQIIVPVTMSVVQKKLYKSILAKNPQLIKAIFNRGNEGQGLKQAERHNLNNLLMQLRKCLCHPFVYSKAIEERSYNAAVSHRNLVEASSKLQLFEMMLPMLQERGHRVLIFSQFLDNLDIVEDFLDGLGLLHRRLDGSMSALEKQKRIDEYNAPDSPYFAFLLSTRSGGVGINLATADTVIIMDPDFNPHQDIQALSRAHRIGQKKKVLVFQLMTRGSAEEKIIQIGRRKMALDHVLIERMDADDETELDLESILRHGAEALFDNDTTDDIQYDTESVEMLLDRTQAENTKTGDDASAESQFSFARIWANDSLRDGDEMGLGEDSGTTTPAAANGNTTVWDKILRERERVAQEEAAAKMQALGRGKRARRAVDYVVENAAGGGGLPSPKASAHESDTDFQAQAHDSDAETDMDMDYELDAESLQHAQEKPSRAGRAKGYTPAKARPFKRVAEPNAFSTMDGVSETDTREMPPAICVACNAPHPVGYCPLKLAGVEHCGLCGIAHIGYSRTCPHLNSEAQVAMMLGSLKASTEQRALVDEATKYLRGIRGDLVRRKKVQALKDAGKVPSRSANDLPIGASAAIAAARNPPPIPQKDPKPYVPRRKYQHTHHQSNAPLQNPYENPYNSLPSSTGHAHPPQNDSRKF
ncbi:hypothetical protein FQN54_000494 [Arachnomyces sp. PD_36]|nr:hypothetical protein FQN54_000494 [Arachnomyces sp. PD_36]